MAASNAPQNLVPLPLEMNGGASSSPGLVQTTTPSADPKPAAAPDTRDPVEAWIEENPTFDPNAAPAPKAEEKPEAVPTDVPPAPTAAPTTEPKADKPPEAPPAPAPTPQAADAPKPTTPEPPKPAVIDPNEDVVLTSDTTWKRAQVVAALEERARVLPLATEAESFHKIFGMNAEDAAKNWAPIVQRLKQEPGTTAFLDSYLANGDKAAYLNACAQHYDANVVPSPAQPNATPAADPAITKEIAELKAWRAEREKQDAVDRMNRELSAAESRYPFLATDHALRNDLLMTASALFERDHSKGILDALALKASIYDALSIARTQSQPPAVPAPEPVAVLGSPGASPTGTRPQADSRPKKFQSTDDALEDWMQTNNQRNYE